MEFSGWLCARIAGLFSWLLSRSRARTKDNEEEKETVCLLNVCVPPASKRPEVIVVQPSKGTARLLIRPSRSTNSITIFSGHTKWPCFKRASVIQWIITQNGTAAKPLGWSRKKALQKSVTHFTVRVRSVVIDRFNLRYFGSFRHAFQNGLLHFLDEDRNLIVTIWFEKGKMIG